jgi:cytochrome c-type biogenesis protein
MPMTRRGIIAVCAVLAVVLIIIGALAYVFITPAKKTRAPDISLNDVYGTPFDLSEQKGKVVLVEFTAVSCTPCNAYMKKLLEIRAKYGPDLVMISIFTYPFETEQTIKDYREGHGSNWTFAKDPGELQVKYSAAPIPKTIIIDKEGYMIFEGQGDIEASKVEGPIDDALKGTASSSVSVASAFISSLGLGGLALMAGLVCFFSPCAFPMLPGYMTIYLQSNEAGGYRKAAAGGTVAALGIFLVYAAVGLIVVALGTAILPYINLMQPVIAVILYGLGVLLLTPFQISTGKFLDRVQGAQEGKGFYFSLFLYGVGYGAASQACTAPVFIGAILAGFQTGSLLTGVGVLLLACTVAFLLMVGVTLLVAGSKKTIIGRLKASTEVIKKVSAVVLIIAAIYILVEYWLAFSG